MSKHFKCDHCGGIYDKNWSDAEAEREYAANFPDLPADTETSIVCDDCFKKMGLGNQ